MLSSSPVRTPTLQPGAEQLSTGECWIPSKKDTPCPRAKEKPQQDSRRGKIAFRINPPQKKRIKPHTCQRCSEGSNKILCSSGDPTETEPVLPLSVSVSHVEVWVSSGLPQGQRLWVKQTWVWHKPSWRRAPLTPSQSCQNLYKIGETDTWRTQTKLYVYQEKEDPGERSSDTTRD